MVMTDHRRVAGSFRDPSGFLFTRDGVLYRQINRSYRTDYDRLVNSGLCQRLVDMGLLVPHQEVEIRPAEPHSAYKVIRPEVIRFISYPYEWSFSQLRDAALTSLTIQKYAVAHGMSLKDCSAYNIQFHYGRPILIDTLSFETLQAGQPWVAYRQFCQHFLAPLALMAYRDVRLGQLLRIHIDGLPLDLVSKLLPVRTWLVFSLLSHIHLHAAAQRRYAGREVGKDTTTRQLGQTALLGLIDSLESAVRRLYPRPTRGGWADYGSLHNYPPQGIEHKKRLVSEYLDRIRPDSVWDLGANTGSFSRLASGRGIPTVAFDADPTAVDENYLTCVRERETNLLPLVLDLTNPSPGLGWQHHERMSLQERGPAGAVLALALIHHLAIANNVPLPDLARFFSQLTSWLVIEWVPKSDSQVKIMLAARDDIFSDYSQESFERGFGECFVVHAAERVSGSQRTLFLMERRGAAHSDEPG
jgi:hypothetical protein